MPKIYKSTPRTQQVFRIQDQHVKINYICTSKSEHVKTKIINTIPSIFNLNKVKYSGINLTKYVNLLYTENYKRLMKEIKDGLNGKI